mmetsp:Transcript_6280/g.19374  ORF Transcript_6280/g.19374 Transcript_6280/m.19374 type:complete len:333 (-) Transcript_6280:1628-2626(-)
MPRSALFPGVGGLVCRMQCGGVSCVVCKPGGWWGGASEAQLLHIHSQLGKNLSMSRHIAEHARNCASGQSFTVSILPTSPAQAPWRNPVSSHAQPAWHNPLPGGHIKWDKTALTHTHTIHTPRGPCLVLCQIPGWGVRAADKALREVRRTAAELAEQQRGGQQRGTAQCARLSARPAHDERHGGSQRHTSRRPPRRLHHGSGSGGMRWRRASGGDSSAALRIERRSGEADDCCGAQRGRCCTERASCGACIAAALGAVCTALGMLAEAVQQLLAAESRAHPSHKVFVHLAKRAAAAVPLQPAVQPDDKCIGGRWNIHQLAVPATGRAPFEQL